MTNQSERPTGMLCGNSRLNLLSRSISKRELTHLLGQASLDELLGLVSAKHPVHFETVRIGDDVLECLQLSDMDAYIDQRVNLSLPGAGVDALPLWAKIWPATLPLAMYMRSLSPCSGEQVLEIGAGIGVAGLFAAKRGFSVTLSDIIPEALLFARINALRSGLGDAVRVLPIDFVKNGHHGRYARIIGSEVLYREQHFEPLLHFFRTHLESRATCEVLLAASAGRHSIKFFAAAKEHFHIARTAVRSSASSPSRCESSEQTTYLYRMRPL